MPSPVQDSGNSKLPREYLPSCRPLHFLRLEDFFIGTSVNHFNMLITAITKYRPRRLEFDFADREVFPSVVLLMKRADGTVLENGVFNEC
jgi:hypothetical protein